MGKYHFCYYNFDNKIIGEYQSVKHYISCSATRGDGDWMGFIYGWEVMTYKKYQKY